MTYEMTKAVTSVDILIYASGVFVILIGIFICLLMVSSKHYSLEIKDDRLAIKSIFYNTDIALTDIELDKIEKINLNESGVKILTRLNGVGLPGLQVGWFSSSKGKVKLYLTDRSEVLSIPTKLNYTILFSTREADRIMREIGE